MDNLPPYLPHLNAGTLRALGVSSSKRWFALPDVPTIAEQGSRLRRRALVVCRRARRHAPEIVAEAFRRAGEGGKLPEPRRSATPGASRSVGIGDELAEQMRRKR